MEMESKPTNRPVAQAPKAMLGTMRWRRTGSANQGRRRSDGPRLICGRGHAEPGQRLLRDREVNGRPADQGHRASLFRKRRSSRVVLMTMTIAMNKRNSAAK